MKPKLLLAPVLLALALPAAASAGGNAKQGKKIYEVLCRVCHGQSGGGDGPAALAIDPPPRNFQRGEFKFDADKDGVTGSDRDLFMVIRKGGATFGGNPVMVSWSTLPDAEVDDLIAYIRTLETPPASGD